MFITLLKQAFRDQDKIKAGLIAGKTKYITALANHTDICELYLQAMTYISLINSIMI